MEVRAKGVHWANLKRSVLTDSGCQWVQRIILLFYGATRYSGGLGA